MRNWLSNLLFPNRIKGVYQFRDADGNPHIFAFTGKRIVELDYETNKSLLVLTMKQIKAAK